MCLSQCELTYGIDRHVAVCLLRTHVNLIDCLLMFTLSLYNYRIESECAGIFVILWTGLFSVNVSQVW